MEHVSRSANALHKGYIYLLLPVMTRVPRSDKNHIRHVSQRRLCGDEGRHIARQSGDGVIGGMVVALSFIACHKDAALKQSLPSRMSEELGARA